VDSVKGHGLQSVLGPYIVFYSQVGYLNC